MLFNSCFEERKEKKREEGWLLKKSEKKGEEIFRAREEMNRERAKKRKGKKREKVKIKEVRDILIFLLRSEYGV